MHRREYLLSATGILGATTIGSIAYTNASVTRQVSSNIADDSAAIIGLDDGPVSGVTTNSDNQLLIDTSTTESSGLNGDATFTYGDVGDPTNTEAFSVKNNDGSAHDLTVGIENMGSLPSGSEFKITFYDKDGGSIGSTSDSTADFSLTGWGSSDTIYAIIDIDTTDANSSNDFSGDIKFSTSQDTSST